MGIVQQAANGGNASPVQATFGSAITAGNTLIVVSNSDTDVTLGAGITRIANNIDQQDFEVGRRALLGGDGQSWGVTFTGTFKTSVQIFEVDEAYEQIGTVYHSISGGQTTIPIPSITPTYDGTTLGLSGATQGSVNPSPSWSNSFTGAVQESSQGTGTGAAQSFTATKQTTGGGAVGTTTVTVASATWINKDGVLVHLSDAPPPVIAHVGTGTPVAGTTSITTAAYPAGWAAGDKIICAVASNHATTEATEPTVAGFTLVGTLNGGGGSQAAGTGNRRLSFFERDAQGGDDTTPTVSLSTGNVMIAAFSAYRATNGTFATTTIATGAETTAGTGWTQAATSDPGFSADDRAVLGYAVRDTTAFSAMGITATGATFAAVEEIAELSSETGNDISLAMGLSTVTAGPSSAAPTITATISTSETGVVGVLRLRQGTAAVPNPRPIRQAGANPALQTYFRW